MSTHTDALSGVERETDGALLHQLFFTHSDPDSGYGGCEIQMLARARPTEGRRGRFHRRRGVQMKSSRGEVMTQQSSDRKFLQLGTSKETQHSKSFIHSDFPPGSTSC